MARVYLAISNFNQKFIDPTLTATISYDIALVECSHRCQPHEQASTANEDKGECHQRITRTSPSSPVAGRLIFHSHLMLNSLTGPSISEERQQSQCDNVKGSHTCGNSWSDDPPTASLTKCAVLFWTAPKDIVKCETKIESPTFRISDPGGHLASYIHTMERQGQHSVQCIDCGHASWHIALRGILQNECDWALYVVVYDMRETA